jgi:hypothetical protein
MADLIGAQGPIACMDLLATTKSTQLYPEQIFADLMCGDNGWGKGRRFITILALPCTSNGLESCKIPIPGQVLDMNPVVASVRNSSGQVVPGYRSTLTQPGAFTDPHIDGISQSQWIFQIHGEKLWLVWPPTEQNLRVLKQSNSYPASHNQHIVLEFLEALEKLQIFIIHPGQSFILPNGFIHACLSLTVSAHTGVEFYTPSDPGTTLRLTETARDTVESRRECGVFKEDTVDTAKEEHYIWLHCLDKSRIDRRLRKHIVANFKACIPEGEMEEHERGMRDRKGRDDKLYIRPSWQ